MNIYILHRKLFRNIYLNIKYRMSLTSEMVKLIDVLKYSNNGKCDVIMYMILQKYYKHEQLSEAEMLHIYDLESFKKNCLLNYINCCS
jgi:hypothetical protein